MSQILVVPCPRYVRNKNRSETNLGMAFCQSSPSSHQPTPAPTTEIPGPDLFMTVIMVSDWAASLYRGTIFIGNVDTNRINHDRIEWHGSTPRVYAPLFPGFSGVFMENIL